MKKLYVGILMLSIVVLALFFSSCAAPQATPVAKPLPPSTLQLTVGQLAQQGKTVLSVKGGCHGDSGQGLRAPAIIGSNAQLAKYNNAKGLLNYITATMPANAPGSLTQQEYLQVLCYILLQNNFAAPDTAIDPNNLEVIELKK